MKACMLFLILMAHGQVVIASFDVLTCRWFSCSCAEQDGWEECCQEAVSQRSIVVSCRQSEIRGTDPLCCDVDDLACTGQ